MKLFYKKSKYGIVLMTVLALLMQIAGPLAANYIYAEELVEDFEPEQVVEDFEPGQLNELMENGGDPVDDLGNIFTDVELKINGTEVDTDTQFEYEDNMQVSLVYDWKIENDVNLKEGSFATTKIPEAFKGIIGRMSGNLEWNKEGETIVVGTYEIGTDNMLTLTFNNELVVLAERQGKVGLNLEFNLEEFKDDSNQIVEFGEPVNKNFIVGLKPKGEDYKVTKVGIPNAEINGTEIYWTIDVNTTLNKFNDLIVKDNTPEGLELVGESIEVFNLTVGYQGKLTEGGKINNPDITYPEGGFQINLGETQSAYRIKYKTTIISYPVGGYKNIAELLDGSDKKGQGEFTVGRIILGSSINKSGVGNNDNENSNKITWTVDVNQLEQILTNVSVQDSPLSPWLTIDNTSIKIFKLKKSGADWEIDSDITENIKSINNNSLKFPLNLGDLNGEAYRIIFDTDIDYQEYKFSNEFKNKAILLVEDTEVGDSEATVTISRKTILEKDGGETTNYGDPKISWTVHVNRANHKIVNATIEDILPAGVELIPNTVKVNDTEFNNYTINNNVLTINLGTIESYRKITYETKITDPNATSFTNNVTLKGDGLTGEGIDEGEIDKSKVVNPSVWNTYNKETVNSKTIETAGNLPKIIYKNVDYQAKTMSWKITVDAKKEEIANLTITDTFVPANTMVFLPDTLRVMKGSQVLVGGYTVTNNDKGGFVLSFPNGLAKGKYEIYFKTSFDPNEILGKGGTLNTVKRYTNKAVFSGQTKDSNNELKSITPGDKSAYYDITEYIANGGKKDGTINRTNRKITWKIYVNSLGQNLIGQDFVILDDIGHGQKFNNDIVVREYSFNANGDIIPGATLDPANYVLSNIRISEEVPENSTDPANNGFTLKFPNGIDKPYLVEYTTNIVGISKEWYRNKAIVSGKSTNKTYDGSVKYDNHNKFIDKQALGINGIVYTDDEINWKVTLNTSLSDINEAVFKDVISKGHVYVNGSLKLYRGAVSETNLVNIDEKLQVTEADDKTTLTLKIGDIKGTEGIYTVTYDTVVISDTGKVSNEASLTGKRLESGQTSKKEFNVRQASWGIGSGINRGAIKLIKQDDENQVPLKGAGFKLEYKLNNEFREVQIEGKNIFYTNDKGEIEFKNLPGGREYRITEIEAPTGYILNNNPHTVITQSNQTIELRIGNEPKKIDIEVEKRWIGLPANSATINLFANGQLKDSIELNKHNYWEHKFENLREYQNGEIINYTIEEVKMENYKEPEIEKDDNGKFIVTNTYVSPKIEISAKKVWVKGPADKPSIQLQLYRDGEVYGEPVELDGEIDEKEEVSWNYIWKGLDLTDINGNVYEYTVKEIKIGDQEVVDGEITNNHTVKVEEGENGEFIITNAYISPKTEIAAEKVWEKGPVEKPSIEVQLYRDGEVYGEPVELDGEIDEKEEVPWNYIWKGLDLTDEYGKAYIYTVKEVTIDGDEVEEGEVVNNYKFNVEKDDNGKFIVTNKYVIPLIDITGTKLWEGGPVSKPSIELQLYRDGVKYEDPVKLDGSEETPWTYTWEELDETDIDGNVYKYTVDEVRVPLDYIKQNSKDGKEVLNIYNPPIPYYPEGRVKLVKKDLGSNELLEGAEFNILNSLNLVVDTLTTNSKGEAFSKYLTVGYYKLQEVKAPEGYKLNNDLIEIRITDGVTEEIVVYNEAKPEEPKDPEEPEEPTDPEEPEEPEEPTDPKDPDEETDIDGDLPTDRPDVPEGEDKPETPDDKPKLPKTGAASSIWAYGLGIALLSIGVFLRKRKQSHN